MVRSCRQHISWIAPSRPEVLFRLRLATTGLIWYSAVSHRDQSRFNRSNHISKCLNLWTGWEVYMQSGHKSSLPLSYRLGLLRIRLPVDFFAQKCGRLLKPNFVCENWAQNDDMKVRQKSIHFSNLQRVRTLLMFMARFSEVRLDAACQCSLIAELEQMCHSIFLLPPPSFLPPLARDCRSLSLANHSNRRTRHGRTTT